MDIWCVLVKYNWLYTVLIVVYLAYVSTLIRFQYFDD